MKLSIEKLHEDYVQYDQLDIEELLPFVKKHIQRKNPVIRFYHVTNFLLVMMVAGFFGYGIARGGAFMPMLAQLGYGIAIAFLLVIVHEWIHGLAYRYVGAQKINYTANWKKFYFTAQADHFVVNEKEFRFVALAPFVIITSFALLAGLFFGKMLLILGLIFVHTSMCGGDFALVSYFYENKEKGLVTYDDFSNQIAYFFVEKTDELVNELINSDQI